MVDTAALQARLAELYPGVDVLSPVQVQEAYATLSSEATSGLVGHFIDARGLYELFGPATAETILGTMEGISQSDHPLAPVLRRALKWLDQPDLDGRQGGVNLGGAAARGMIDALTGTVFTPEQAALLKGLAVEEAPRWPGLTVADLEALYRPAWEAAYHAEQAAIQELADLLRSMQPGLSEREARDQASHQLHNPD